LAYAPCAVGPLRTRDDHSRSCYHTALRCGTLDSVDGVVAVLDSRALSLPTLAFWAQSRHAHSVANRRTGGLAKCLGQTASSAIAAGTRHPSAPEGNDERGVQCAARGFGRANGNCP